MHTRKLAAKAGRLVAIAAFAVGATLGVSSAVAADETGPPAAVPDDAEWNSAPDDAEWNSTPDDAEWNSAPDDAEWNAAPNDAEWN